MKFYGWYDFGPDRGELQAVVLKPPLYRDADTGEAQWVAGWETAYSRFSVARAALVRRMKEIDADPELIALVRSLRASDVPTETYS